MCDQTAVMSRSQDRDHEQVDHRDHVDLQNRATLRHHPTPVPRSIPAMRDRTLAGARDVPGEDSLHCPTYRSARSSSSVPIARSPEHSTRRAARTSRRGRRPTSTISMTTRGNHRRATAEVLVLVLRLRARGTRLGLRCGWHRLGLRCGRRRLGHGRRSNAGASVSERPRPSVNRAHRPSLDSIRTRASWPKTGLRLAFQLNPSP